MYAYHSDDPVPRPGSKLGSLSYHGPTQRGFRSLYLVERVNLGEPLPRDILSWDLRNPMVSKTVFNIGLQSTSKWILFLYSFNLFVGVAFEIVSALLLSPYSSGLTANSKFPITRWNPMLVTAYTKRNVLSWFCSIYAWSLNSSLSFKRFERYFPYNCHLHACCMFGHPPRFDSRHNIWRANIMNRCTN